jgi:hypothetical protein
MSIISNFLKLNLYILKGSWDFSIKQYMTSKHQPRFMFTYLFVRNKWS